MEKKNNETGINNWRWRENANEVVNRWMCVRNGTLLPRVRVCLQASSPPCAAFTPSWKKATIPESMVSKCRCCRFISQLPALGLFGGSIFFQLSGRQEGKPSNKKTVLLKKQTNKQTNKKTFCPCTRTRSLWTLLCFWVWIFCPRECLRPSLAPPPTSDNTHCYVGITCDRRAEERACWRHRGCRRLSARTFNLLVVCRRLTRTDCRAGCGTLAPPHPPTAPPAVWLAASVWLTLCVCVLPSGLILLFRRRKSKKGEIKTKKKTGL